MPFESDENFDKKPNLKLGKNVATQAPINHKKELEQKAKESLQLDKDIADRIKKVSASLNEIIIENKTLPKNKTNIQKDIEKEIINEILNIGTILNQDETKPEGYGSMATINLLFKIILKQKDIINTLDYRISNLESKNKNG